MLSISRKTWHKWHRLAGLNLAFLMGFVLLTGTLAVLSNELDYVFNPAVRASPTSGHAFNWPRAYAAVLDAAGQRHVSALSLPLHNGFAAEAIVVNSQGLRGRLYVDPVHYTVTGGGRWYNWRTTLRQLHRHLMLPLWLGLAIVSGLSFLLLVSLVSGLCVYRHWWKGLWQFPRRHHPRLFWTDLHRFAGLWSVWLLIIITVTGLWYFVEQHGLKSRFPAQQKPVVENPSLPVTVAPATLATAVAKVREIRPTLEIKTVFFPSQSGTALRIDGQAGNVLVRDRANNVLFNPQTGVVLDQRFGHELNAHVRIAEAADPLHFGNWGGYWSKIPYFVFGLVLSSLTLTGIYLVALREVKVTRSETVVSQFLLLKRGMQQMGKSLYPSLVLVAISLVLTACKLITYPALSGAA